MLKWLNRATFDVIGYLVFGGSFYGLEEARDPIMISFIFDFVSTIPVMQFALQYGFMDLLERFTPGEVAKRLNRYRNYSEKQVAKVLNGGDTTSKQGLFFASVRREDGNHELTLKQCSYEARSMLLAGSEVRWGLRMCRPEYHRANESHLMQTTATTISGVLYYLSLNPATCAKHLLEIRSTFNPSGKSPHHP